jgi:hypothetical protein
VLVAAGFPVALVIAWGRRPIENRSENISVHYPLISDF